MNQTAYDFALEAAHDPSAAVADALWREARKDGRVVLTLRCARSGDGYVVAAEAFPLDGTLGTPPDRRSYSFDDRQDAELFVNDAVRALEYLGCTIQ